MVVGVAIQSAYHHYSNFVDDSIAVTPVLLIAVGAIVFVIAFFGCCGAIKKSPCMIGKVHLIYEIVSRKHY